jgi:parallel beta-helix repeat protein
LATVTNFVYSQTAIATEVVTSPRVTSLAAWSTKPSTSTAVTGVVALEPSTQPDPPQAITFTSSPPASPTVGGSYTVSATGGGSGNPVAFSIDASSTSGACSISGATVSFTGVGSCVIDANQAAAGSYSAAPQVQQSFTIAAAGGSGGGSGSSPPSSTGAPSTPPIEVCGNSDLLNGPATTPAGSVTIPAGDNTAAAKAGDYDTANTTYYFAAGTHYMGNGIFPGTNSIYIGAPGAIIEPGPSGTYPYYYNFEASSGTNVTIEYLTFEHFSPGNNGAAVPDGAVADWTFEYDTFQDNGNVQGSGDGAGLAVTTGDVVEYDCFTNNGQYGLTNVGGPSSDITIENNEISYNGISEFPDESCGCSGGMKFDYDAGSTISDNYVHDNYNVGIWLDYGNTGETVDGNYVAGNWASGFNYEISNDATVDYNTFIDNDWGGGSYAVWDFPGSAVYISGSSGVTVSYNVFTDNWGGVVLYQDPNRFCGSSVENACVLASNTATYNDTTCTANVASSSPGQSPDYYDDCQQKLTDNTISYNTFNFSAADIQNATPALPDETVADCVATTFTNGVANNTGSSPPTGDNYLCGFNGLFSSVGSYAPYNTCPQGYCGWAIPDSVMGFGPDPDSNVFENNTYNGDWAFQAYAQGGEVWPDLYHDGIATEVNLALWQSLYGQDAGSTG